MQLIRRLVRLIEKKRLVGSGQKIHCWADLGGDLETITFLFFETASGRRSYKIHSYGMCRTFETHRRHEGELLAWKHGGPLPGWATPAGVSRSTKPELRLVKR